MPNENEILEQEQQKKAQLEAEAKAKAEAEAKAKAEADAKAKADEEAKKQAEQNGDKNPEKKPEEKPAHSVDDYVLKTDLDSMFNPLAGKIDALLNHANKLEADNKELAEKKAQLEKEKAELQEKEAKLNEEINGLKDKYENTSFGNVAHGGEINPSQKSTKYVSFDEYVKQFGFNNK